MPRKNAAELFRALASEAGRELNGILTPHDWIPCSIFAATAQPTRVFVFPRDVLIRRLIAAESWPKDWAAVVRQGVPPAWFVKTLVERCAAIGVKPSFVGDLDPLDIHIFHAYKNADPWLGGQKRLPFHFLGVDDRWIQLDRRWAKPGQGSFPSSSPMNESEREHFKLLSTALDLESVIGPESLAFLKAGRKIEMDNAASEALFGPAILKDIVALLRDRP